MAPEASQKNFVYSGTGTRVCLRPATRGDENQGPAGRHGRRPSSQDDQIGGYVTLGMLVSRWRGETGGGDLKGRTSHARHRQGHSEFGLPAPERC